MSTRVGWATLSVIPSARNFGRQLQKDIQKPITDVGKDSGKLFGEHFTRAASGIGRPVGVTVGDGMARGFAPVVSDRLPAVVRSGPWSQLGTEVGERFGLTFTDAVRKHSRASGRTSALDFMSGFGTRVGSGLSAVVAQSMTTLPLLAIGAGVGAALSTAIGAAITSGVLLGIGGGVLAAGIAAAVRQPAVEKAWSRLGTTAETAFAKFGRPFEKPLIRAAATFDAALKTASPSLVAIGKTIAPIVDRLAPAFATMALNALPGIQSLATASVPFFNSLANLAPQVGTTISRFFQIFADGGPSATQAFTLFARGTGKALLFFAQQMVSLTNRFIQIVRWAGIIGQTVAPAFDRVRTAVQGFFTSASQTGAITKLRGFFASLREPLANLGKTFGDIGKRLAGVWTSDLKPFFADLIKTAGPTLTQWGDTIRTVLGELSPILTQVANAAGFLWSKLGLGSVILGAIKTLFSGLMTSVKGTMQVIKGAFQLISGVLTGDWAKMWNGLKTIAEGVWNLILGGLKTLFVVGFGGILKAFIPKIAGWFAPMISRVTGMVGGWVSRIIGFFTSLRSRAQSTISGMVGKVAGFFVNMFNQAALAVARGAGTIYRYMRDLASKVIGPIRDLVGRFAAIGRDVISGFIRGIQSGAGRIIGAIKSAITDRLPDYVKKALGIHSPSRVFMALGEHVAAGMALGIERGTQKVTRAMSALTALPDGGNVTVGATLAAGRAGAPTPVTVPLILDGRQIAEAVFTVGGSDYLYGRRVA